MKIILYTVYSDGTLEHADENGCNQRIMSGTYKYTSFIPEAVSNGYLPVFVHRAVWTGMNLPIFEL